MEYRQRKVTADFFVCQETGPTLLGYNLVIDLGIVVVNGDTYVANSVFEGPSSVPDSWACQLYLRDGTKAKSFPTRRLPIGLHDPVKEEVAKMVAMGTIEVKTPTDRCSPIDVALKKSGQIRLCVDFRYLNSCLRRPELQMPTIEEASARVGSARVFTKLDCANSF